MRSSISSSDTRAIPAGDWPAIWLITLGLALGATILCELVTRDHGQRPSVVDDPLGWRLMRRTVDDDARVVAFVGTSRMQLALSGREVAVAAPGVRGVQLAINGVPAIGVLQDLANDERFHGLAVVDVDEWDVTWGDLYDEARPYVAPAHALWRSPGALANRWLAVPAQEHLAVLAMGGRHWLGAVLHGRWPSANWLVTDRERITEGDMRGADPALMRARAVKRLANFDQPPPSPEAWLARALAIEPLVQRIRAHGGDVAIVRLPVSGRLAQLFERDYPRDRYWNAFAARSSASVIHYGDLPALRNLESPDEMHVDQRDQAAVTAALVDELVRRGVIHVGAR